MILTIRGFKIRCYAKPGNKHHYVRLYESYSDEALAQFEKEDKTTEPQSPCFDDDVIEYITDNYEPQGSRSK